MKSALVLEGGGMRGIYTAGVIDFFLESNIETDAVFGVSAGALHGINYVSGQKGRGRDVNLEYLDDKRYLSVKSLIKTGDMFGVKFCYHDIPDKLNLFDYDTYRNSHVKMYAVCSNLETGKAEYIECKDLKFENDLNYIRASASLPMLSKIVMIDNNPYLDGGICDSIPVLAARKFGYKKRIVVLTRPKEYRKEPNKMMTVIKRKYKKYPQFVRALQRRHIKYNTTLEKIEELEARKEILVIRPSKPFSVSRLEKDRQKLKSLYDMGYEDAKENIDEIKKYLEI